MRKLIVHEFITLDGVIQAPGGEDEDRDGGFARRRRRQRPRAEGGVG